MKFLNCTQVREINLSIIILAFYVNSAIETKKRPDAPSKAIGEK
jgi:hypothetical protein